MEEKRLLYIEVHQQKKQGLRISQISKRTKLTRTTIYKYLALDFEEAIEEFDHTSRKK
ncbi:MAG: helix-turn-helix domain-containing protein [Firmicutes bacterium]|nr:helix-turn-helix domain-containing protein [Bacillota bacterium]